MYHEAVMQEITRQCAALVRSGQAPVFVQLGNHQYATLAARLGPHFGDVEVDEPAGEVDAAPQVPVHFPVAAGRHVLGVERLDVDDHLRVVGSARPAIDTID